MAEEPLDDWEQPARKRVLADAERLLLDIDGWEGPLDLLLDLARNQKVDLREISILELVGQYLGFIETSRHLKLELAADYLVMAAWLAFLKSALMLPDDPEQDPSPHELALRLQLRLQRLDAMRDAGARLMARDRVGRDVFMRGNPEGLASNRSRIWQASLYDLLAAYGQVKARSDPAVHHISRRPVWTLEDAIGHLSAIISTVVEWRDIAAFLPQGFTGALRKSALASTFVAALELARTGQLELEQDGAFEPLHMRAKS